MQGILRRFGARWAMLACLWLCASVAQARMHKVDAGEVPVLEPGEGLLVMAVDSDIDLSSVSLVKDNRLFGAGMMTHLSSGRSYRLYVAPAGDYTWSQVEMLASYHVKLREDPEFKFKVEAGRITYPGDLLFRSGPGWRVEAAMANRGLAAIDWLQREHAGVYARYEFAYSGHYPDPFPAFYRVARAAHADAKPADKVALQAPPAPGTLPIAAKTLFREDRIQEASLNPAGDLLALHVHEGKDEWQVVVVDLAARKSSVVAASAVPFDRIEWAENVLLASVDPPAAPNVVRAFRFGPYVDGKRSQARLKLPDGGSVIDTLPSAIDEVLYATSGRNGELLVHRLDISSQASIEHRDRSYVSRLNAGVKDDVAWFADGHGNLRLAVLKRDQDYVLVRRNGGGFEDVMVLSEQDDFDPVGVSFEADVIYAITDQDRDQRELVAYDVAARKIVRTLFAKPGVDVRGVYFDDRREPVGVTYYRGGRLVSEYFDEAGNRLMRSLQAAFPGRTVTVAARSRDGKHVALWADAGDQPPQLYHLDVDKRQANLVDEDMPWLDGMRFAPSEVVRFKGADGLPLEAFLTLPPGPGRRPLVVFPHGGPIGVADTLGFDPEVQFLASLGYAVLRVNYRGSAGYGRAFREAGKRGFGTLIEDDIDAAIREVLAKYPLDEKRMCAVGSSYGGYSAMVMAIRWPERFRCVVSIAGVADRILFFTASDGGRTAKGREELERVLGDPKAELEAMQATSPLYQFDKLRVPVMLVHGLEDRRVDEEHTRRMLRMLDMAGRTPVGMEFAGEGHGFDDPENIEKLWNGVAGFLRAHLDGSATPASAAAAVAPAPAEPESPAGG